MIHGKDAVKQKVDDSKVDNDKDGHETQEGEGGGQKPETDDG